MSSNHNDLTLYIMKLLIINIGMFLSTNVFCADNDYDIEIVIFEDVRSKYSDSESWPLIPEEYVATDKNASGSRVMQSDKRIKILQDESLRLSSEIRRIEESNEYKVLIHTAWRQPGLDKPSSFPVHIATNKQADNDTISYIEGDVTLVMSRYLHVSGNLMLYKESNGGYVPYPISFDRRMRSREKHYIDHPMVGILVLVTPVNR